MKCVTLLAIFVFSFIQIQAAPTDLYAADMKLREKMGLECLKQVQIDREVIEEAKISLNRTRHNQKYKEFLACSFKKQGFQSSDGKILYDNVNDFLSRYYNTEDLKILDECRQVTGSSDAELAFNALECIMSNLNNLEEKSENSI